MSWSTSASNLSRDAIADIETGMQLLGEPAEQFDKAKEIATAIVDSGVVGDPAKHTFNVWLSGHANPGHEPAEGWSPDCVYVSVSQASQPHSVANVDQAPADAAAAAEAASAEAPAGEEPTAPTSAPSRATNSAEPEDARLRAPLFAWDP